MRRRHLEGLYVDGLGDGFGHEHYYYFRTIRPLGARARTLAWKAVIGKSTIQPNGGRCWSWIRFIVTFSRVDRPADA